MADNIQYTEVSLNNLGSYLEANRTTQAPAAEPATEEVKPDAEIGYSLAGQRASYIPVPELISMYKKYGEIPNIPFEKYTLDEYKEMQRAGLDIGTIIYDGIECNLDQLINIWEGDIASQEMAYQNAIKSGNLFEMDWGNKDGQYMFTTGVSQSGLGTYGYIGHGNTKFGALVETSATDSDGNFDIGFKPKVSVRQNLSAKTFTYANYSPNDSVFTVGAAYTPDNHNYVSANLSTDKNSIFNVKASFTF